MRAIKSSENRTLRVKSKQSRQLKKSEKRRMIMGKVTEAKEQISARDVVFHHDNKLWLSQLNIRLLISA